MLFRDLLDPEIREIQGRDKEEMGVLLQFREAGTWVQGTDNVGNMLMGRHGKNDQKHREVTDNDISAPPTPMPLP